MIVLYDFLDTYASDIPGETKHIDTFGIPYPIQSIQLDIELTATIENGDPVFNIDPLSGIALLQKVETGYQGESPIQTTQGEGSLFYADSIFCDNQQGKQATIEIDTLPVGATASAVYYSSVTIREIGLIPEHGKDGQIIITLGRDTDIVGTVANLAITSVNVVAYGIPYNMEFFNRMKTTGNLFRLRTSSFVQKTINGTDVIVRDVLDIGRELIGWITDAYNASTVALGNTKLLDGDIELTDIDYYGYQTVHNLNTNHQVDPDTFINVQVAMLENPYRVNSKYKFKVTSSSDIYLFTFLYREPVS